MGWGNRQVESAAVLTAALAMAGATAFAMVSALGPAAALLAGPGAFAVVAGWLRRIDRKPLRLPHFAVQPLSDFDGADELLLTEVLKPSAPELLLEDALEHPANDARVVRLFDVQPQRCARESADASDALRQALSELRRSLR